MSNKRKPRTPRKPKPQICEACQRGEHTGRPHLLDGTPIITPEDLQRMRAGLS